MRIYRENPTYKAEQITKSSYILGILWTSSMIILTVFIGITGRFFLWWILIILCITSVIMLIWHWKTAKDIVDDYNRKANIDKFKWMWLLQILTLNFPLFAYEVVGLVFYKKAYLKF